MTMRVSASSLPVVERVKADDLTPMERDALASSGEIGPDGFVDIEKPATPELVDLKAEARKKAVTAMQSVVGGRAVPPAPAPAPVSQGPSNDEYIKELETLQDKLKSRSPCPRCGLGIDEPCEVTVAPADVQEFLKCVLSGSAFTKSYSLFGGALVVTLQTRAGIADEFVRKAVTEAMRSRELTGETEVFALMRQLTTATTLQSYVTKEIRLDFPALPYTTAAEFRQAADDRMGKIPAQIQGFLRPVVTDFNMLVELLTARAQDPSFWVRTPAQP